MNYIGSKQTLLPFLYECIKQVTTDDEKANVFCDILRAPEQWVNISKPKDAKL